MPHLAVTLAVLLVTTGDPPDPLAALEDAIARAIARAEPSVVAISRARIPGVEETTAVRGKQQDPRQPLMLDLPDLSDPDFLPMPGDFGSGVVVGPKGEIVTAFHVVRGAARIYVRAPNRQAFDAEILAADPRSDLAVIAPRAMPGVEPPRLTPLALGDAEKLRKGSFLVLLGNPYHTARDGRASASWGILSNTTRRIVPPRPELPEMRQMFQHQPTLLQLDARLNLGMSGGAVVNLKGELVGISTTGGNAEGFDAQAGYAIPVDEMGRRVIETLRQGKEVEYGFLGIRLGEGASNVVGPVEAGTPAAQGDLVIGDVILAVGDRPVNEESNLSLALGSAPVGQPIKLKVRRDGRELEKTVFISKYPVTGEVIATNRPAPWRGLRVDFTSVLGGTIFPEEKIRAMARGCVGVIEVEPDSPADRAGLRKGEVITHVAGKPVRSPAEFNAAVGSRKGAVVLETDRGKVTVK
jgi:S1-C subfamily serine protease